MDAGWTIRDVAGMDKQVIIENEPLKIANSGLGGGQQG
jgi:hypothetical protein